MSRYSSETPEKYPNNDNHFETFNIIIYIKRRYNILIIIPLKKSCVRKTNNEISTKRKINVWNIIYITSYNWAQEMYGHFLGCYKIKIRTVIIISDTSLLKLWRIIVTNQQIIWILKWFYIIYKKKNIIFGVTPSIFFLSPSGVT